MERQTEGKALFPPFAERLIERGFREGKLDGLREGKIDGLREGKLDGKRDALRRLLTRAGIALTEDERASIRGCADPALLDRWVDNVLGAKTASDVLS